MHANTSDGAEKALAALKSTHVKDVDPAALTVGLRTAKDQPCPDCGWPVINWYSGNQLDPGDVDPRADCTNPDCGWGY
jgi:hypothetical protein